MINKTVMSFINKVNEDPALHAKVTGQSHLEVLLKTASENGFNFTADEWMSTVQAIYSGELSDDDLANIAGGAVFPSKPNPLGILPGGNATAIPPFGLQ
ncbi:MAG TPA: Nif11-like leader peptide family RiPP precursor [Aggregatilineales bacterium]|nr:Nif11-like leader peptide family RiPP precursor [Aggregatilineales bacterium]